jgi:uncharacterized protein (TIGR02246 family)
MIQDEQEIRSLIERWSKAVRDENLAAIRADHGDDMLMFDVPPPFLSRGLDAYMSTWRLFFSSVEKPVVFHFTDVEVTAGVDVAFATAIGHCVNIDRTEGREPLDFRLTMGLRKIGGRWQIAHEHHSLPAV